MKKTMCLILCSALILLGILSVSACPGTEDVIYKDTIDVDAIIPLKSTIIEQPEENAAAAAAEDVIYVDVIDPEDILPLTPIPITNERGINGITLEFDGAIPNSYYSDFIEHDYDEGDTAVLYVELCTWVPQSYDLEIGITNFLTGEHFYVIETHASVNNKTIRFRNLTEGHYSVTVRNLGTSPLTTGVLEYTLS